jgi:two-component system sensor histidine kinase GlrK
MELTPAEEMPPVRMDEERVFQVLENLIGNALKFTPEGGRVVVNATRDAPSRQLKVAVVDTGGGISEKNLIQIFNKFKRIDSGKETTIGTGLGLAIAKHIIADHGGKIWVESRLAKGSSFFFTLPFARSSSQA